MTHFDQLALGIVLCSLAACTASSAPSTAGTTTSKQTTEAKNGKLEGIISVAATNADGDTLHCAYAMTFTMK